MKHRYIKNVATLILNESTCGGCGMCIEVCPHKVWELYRKKARIVDRDSCIECGACARNCPVEAVTVTAGVGCAYAVIKSSLTGGEPTCCSSRNSDCC